MKCNPLQLARWFHRTAMDALLSDPLPRGITQKKTRVINVEARIEKHVPQVSHFNPEAASLNGTLAQHSTATYVASAKRWRSFTLHQQECTTYEIIDNNTYPLQPWHTSAKTQKLAAATLRLHSAREGICYLLYTTMQSLPWCYAQCCTVLFTHVSLQGSVPFTSSLIVRRSLLPHTPAARINTSVKANTATVFVSIFSALRRNLHQIV